MLPLTNREIEMRQLHLRLTKEELPWLVWETARVALKGFLGREPSEAEVTLAVPGVKALLRRLIVACDLCGLTVLCHEAEEYDPWVELEGKGLL